MNIAHLERSLHRQWRTTHDPAVARAQVIERYARLGVDGRPIFCTPSRRERSGAAPRRESPGTDGKLIFDSQRAAWAAARAFAALGSKPMRPYLCGRSRHGHLHLTTKAAS